MGTGNKEGLFEWQWQLAVWFDVLKIKLLFDATWTF